MKKLISLLLAAALFLSGTALAESVECEYDTPVSFSLSSCFMSMGANATDAFSQYVYKKFNVKKMTLMFNDNATHDETTRTWVNAGTMPDVTQWMTFQNSEYRKWVEQGLIKALPDGWENDYPNLYNMVQTTGLDEYLKVDGKTYAVPHALFCNYDDGSLRNYGVSVFYRKDWAEELGFEWAGNPSITMSQLHDYCKAAAENNMSGWGHTYGLAISPSYLMEQMSYLLGYPFGSFVNDKDNGCYIWGLKYQQEKLIKLLEQLRSWYKDGTIHPDFYLQNSDDASNAFTSGLSAATICGCNLGQYRSDQLAFENAYDDLRYTQCVGAALLTNDDGSVFIGELVNFWTTTIFNPNIDEEVFHRVLAIMDYFCTPEGTATYAIGFEGSDWYKDENGKYHHGVAYSSSVIYCFLSVLSNDFEMNNPLYARFVDSAMAVCAERQKAKEIPHDFDYDFYYSDLKDIYSVESQDKLVEIIMGDMDISQALNDFITENKGMVDPLEKELNEVFYQR